MTNTKKIKFGTDKSRFEKILSRIITTIVLYLGDFLLFISNKN
jgi:hypothetical protein